jgi:DNA polymerase I
MMSKSNKQGFFEGFEPTEEQPKPQAARRSSRSKPVVSPQTEVQVDSVGPAKAKSTAPSTVEVTFSIEAPEIPDDLSGQTVVLIDSHSLIYQIFHALAPMTSPAGLPVTTIFGFLRDIADLRDRWQAAFVWCAFDLSEVTFRNELYPEYKAHRDPMPDELRLQIPLIRETLPLLGVGIVDAEGFEADDVIATLAAQIEAVGGRCIIVTSDKDCRQLITDNVCMYNIRKQEVFDAAKLREIWGIRPNQVVDFQSLVGDSVDNVPGIPLIGPKLAQQLLEQFDNLDQILANPEAVSGKKRADNIREHRDKALLSRDLVRLRTDVPLDLDWRDANFSRRNAAALKAKFEEFGFRRLIDRLVGVIPQAAVEPQQWTLEYTTVDTAEKLQWLADQLRSSKRIALDTETTSTNPRWAEAVGYSFSWELGKAAYIPLRAPHGVRTLSIDQVAVVLNPILSDPTIEKIGQNIKYDLIVLKQNGIEVAGVKLDTMVADYLIDPGQRDHSLDDLARRHLQHETIKISELIGTGRDQLTMDQVPVSKITPYACQDADLPWRMCDLLTDQLEQLGLTKLFESVEVPLIEVLAEMEYFGIRVDTDRLKSLRDIFELRIKDLQTEIIQLAGEAFNLDSPKQLQTILYDKLKLPIVKRIQTGVSTDAEVLQQLAMYHPLPVKLLEYRQLTKLKGTYIDALPELVCPKTGRVHTSFRQDVAATGRLSSSDPNLQNIPIRTEEGRHIRSAFRAGDDNWLLLAADYSQIELRVLAHYCGDEALRDAFLNDRDVHTQVASEVYGVSLDAVTSAQRRSAKAINFGIIYGQSPFGLAKSLQISKSEAAEFIQAYFDRFPGVRKFIEQTIMTCREQGYVSTMLDRRRRVKGVRDFANLSDSRKQVMIEPERIAVNTVIQGSAADLIKLAMLRVRQRLVESKLQARMLLQIHDELLFEVAQVDCDALAELVKNEMIAVAQLSVPLKVDVKSGKNWAECD